ncbi:Retrotransposable element Tf2 [Cucumis melo var. makuwa]|uniref:Retrotransposable element Tf2 n=1 Tax=Cucumis melo var. makuwa TaxID=1194695 RepID=A0A5A7VE26_CUCMM|nr:Retrotransposable element Tf2 [Cucumis melo var. makuwa]
MNDDKTDVRQPNELKRISTIQLKKGLTQDEPTFMAIPLDLLDNLREIGPMDILCVLEKYHDVMPDSLPNSLVPQRIIDHEIELLPRAKSPAKNAYRIAPPELAELQKQLDELLNEGFIRPAKAPYEALVLFQKKDGSLRLCIGYRALNKLTILVYLDDIVVYSSTIEEHKDHLRNVFQKLKKNQLYVKREKCSFAQERINFLGHVIECGRIGMEEGKIATICDWCLTELLKKDVQWGWTPECQVAFDGLKKAMMDRPVLGIADVTKPFEGSSNQAADALSRKNEYVAMCMSAHLQTSKIDESVSDVLREFLQKDPTAQNVMNLAKMGKTRQFWIEEDLLVTKGNQLYVPRVVDLRKKLLHEYHDTLWAGHLGRQSTYTLLKKSYFWPNMRDDVMQYIKTCLINQQNKVEKVKVTGLLDPLSVPIRPWENISMDFITLLSKIGKNPQGHNFMKEWKQTTDIAQVYLEKASRRMKKCVDKKRRPIEFLVTLL